MAKNEFDENKEIIEELKRLINKNFVGKEIEIEFMNRLHRGIVINETKNTFEIIEDEKIKKFIKNAIKFRVKIDEKWSKMVKGKYFTQRLEERLRQKVIFFKNPLLEE